MGLDLVELVMEVEDEFGIQIADDDASHIETVGQLHSYVCRKIGSGHAIQGRCHSMAVFHRVREALVNTGIAATGEITLETDLSEWATASPQAWYFFLRTL